MGTIDTDGSEIEFEQKLVYELEKLAALNISIEIKVVSQANRSSQIFSTKRWEVEQSIIEWINQLNSRFSCKTHREKVLDLRGKSSNEIFDMEFDQDGCKVKFYFYCLEDPSNNIMCTTNYFNPHFTQTLTRRMRRQQEGSQIMKTIGFIGFLSADRYATVDSIVRNALQRIISKVKVITETVKEAKDLEDMSSQDVEVLLASESDQQPEEVSHGRQLRSRQKPQVVDLTASEEENIPEDPSAVLRGEVQEAACSDIQSLGLDCEKWDEQVDSSAFFKPPYYKVIEKFMKEAEFKSDQLDGEIPSLEELRKQFARSEIRVEKKMSGEIPWDGREDPGMFSSSKFLKRPEPDEAAADSRHNERPWRYQPESKTYRAPRSTILLSDSEVDELNRNKAGCSKATRDRSPVLGRGLGAGESLIVELDAAFDKGAKPRLLDNEEYERYKRERKVVVSKQQIEDNQKTINDACGSRSMAGSYKIPKYSSSQGDRDMSDCSIKIQRRPPINSRNTTSSSVLSQFKSTGASSRNARMLENLNYPDPKTAFSDDESRSPRTPASISSFIDKPSDPVINLDDDDDDLAIVENSENTNDMNNNGSKLGKRKLYLPSPPVPTRISRIFTSKNPKPDFSSQYGDSRKSKR